jgi:RimJ/RimL family protein N-acetyltransferase
VIEVLRGEGFSLRRAAASDADFLATLAVNEDVSPFLAVMSARDVDAFLEEIEGAEAAPHERGRFVIDADEEDARWAAGSVAFEVRNRRSKIAHLYGLMLHPSYRGRGLARSATRLFTDYLLTDLGYHRVELECYGYNERAIRHFERAGFVREGVKRKAYWRNDEWVDGVFFGLVREDLGPDGSLPDPPSPRGRV